MLFDELSYKVVPLFPVSIIQFKGIECENFMDR